MCGYEEELAASELELETALATWLLEKVRPPQETDGSLLVAVSGAAKTTADEKRERQTRVESCIVVWCEGRVRVRASGLWWPTEVQKGEVR